jgi:hypothetical protein
MLDEAVAWRDRVCGEAEAALALVTSEEQVARRVMVESQRQHAALVAIRREEEERLSALEESALQRKRSCVRQAMIQDRGLLEERAARLSDAWARRDADLGHGLDDVALLSAVRQYVELQESAASGEAVEVEAQLAPSARRVLEPYLDAAALPPPRLDLAPVGVAVLVSADPPVGPSEALVMVLPVPWAVYAEGTLRAEDLCTHLAYRLVAALYSLLGAMGAAQAPVRFAELQGCLAVQVWLGDHAVEEDLRDRVLEAISAAVEEAPELEAAGVEVFAVWLTPDLLAEAAS